MLGDTDKVQNQTVRALLALRELVLSGELLPGERVSELAMVDRIGVSRTPLRTALVKLEGEGFLEALPNGGYAARQFSIDDAFAAIEVRGAMEGLAARLAAERRPGDADLAAIRETQNRIDRLLNRRKSGDSAYSEFAPLNEMFHRQLAELSGSPVVFQQIERANAHPFASPSGFIQIQTQMPQAWTILLIAQDHHHCILEALSAGEGGRVEALTREHARLAQRYLREAFNDQHTLDQIPGASMLRRTG